MAAGQSRMSATAAIREDKHEASTIFNFCLKQFVGCQQNSQGICSLRSSFPRYFAHAFNQSTRVATQDPPVTL